MITVLLAASTQIALGLLLAKVERKHCNLDIPGKNCSVHDVPKVVTIVASISWIFITVTDNSLRVFVLLCFFSLIF